MRSPLLIALLAACGCLLIVPSANGADVAERKGQSTLRTVRVSRPHGETAAVRRSAPLPARTSLQLHTQPSAPAYPEASSLVIVGSKMAEPPAEGGVQLASYTTIEPLPIADVQTQSSIPANEPASQVAAAQSLEASAASAPASHLEPTSPNSTAKNVAEQLAESPFTRPVAATSIPSIPDLPAVNRTPQTPSFLGGYSARATLSQMPRPARRPAPMQPVRQPVKPFQSVPREPTFSPYHHLYRAEDEVESLPNYYAFVRPQLEQMEAQRRQQLKSQRQQRRLQGQAAAAAAPIPMGIGPERAVPSYGPTAAPSFHRAARFMDTGQYYDGLPR